MSDFNAGLSSKSKGLGVHGKTLYYKTNGTGRDSYIASNNGGMTITSSPRKGPDVGTRY